MEAFVRAATLAQHLDLCEKQSALADAECGERSEACWSTGQQAEPNEPYDAKARDPYCKVSRIGGDSDFEQRSAFATCMARESEFQGVLKCAIDAKR